MPIAHRPSPVARRPSPVARRLRSKSRPHRRRHVATTVGQVHPESPIKKPLISGLCRRELQKWRLSKPEDGAGKRSRTPDLRITNALLYQLSYSGQAFDYSEGC